MTQSIINNKFIQYLQYEAEDYLAELEEEMIKLPHQSARIQRQAAEFIEYTSKLYLALDKGHCHGFALAQGAMKVMGKLNWWEHALVDIANWDEQRASLALEVKLSDSIPQKGKKQTRKNIINRALNYIVILQAGDIARNIFPEITQLDILLVYTHSSTNRSYIEIVNEDASPLAKKVLTTTHERRMAGNFITKESLSIDLESGVSSNSIVLVTNKNHTINMSRTGNTWIVYNANYDHTQTQSLHILGNQSQCIDEVFKILKSVLYVQVANFEENARINYPEYDRMLSASPLPRLEINNIHLMLSYNSDEMSKILPEKKSLSPDEKKMCLKKLTEFITAGTSSRESILPKIIHRAPVFFNQILKLIDDSEEGRQLLYAIIKSIRHKKLGFTPYEIYSNFYRLMEHINKTQFGVMFCSSMVSVFVNSHYRLEALMICDYFQGQLKYVKQQHVGFRQLLAAMFEYKKNDQLAWDACSEYTRQCLATYFVEAWLVQPIKITDNSNRSVNLSYFVKLMLELPDGFRQLLKKFSNDIYNNLGKSAKRLHKTGWQIICDKMPNDKIQIIALIQTKINQMDIEALNELAALSNHYDYRSIFIKKSFFTRSEVRTDFSYIILNAIQTALRNNTDSQHSENLNYNLQAIQKMTLRA